MAFSGLRLRPRELARVGRLLLDGGQRLVAVPQRALVVVITAGRSNQPGNGVPSSRLLREVLATVQQG